MIATVMAAITTFGSLIRIEIESRDAIQFWGLGIWSWVCFGIFKIKEKSGKTPLKTFIYNILPDFIITLAGFIFMFLSGNLYMIIMFYIILVCFWVKLAAFIIKVNTTKAGE